MPSFSISSGNAEGKFAIDGATGDLTIATLFDYETTQLYSLVIEATDGGATLLTGTAFVSVRIGGRLLIIFFYKYPWPLMIFTIMKCVTKKYRANKF